MSMIGNFLAVAENKANALMNDPDLIADLLYSEESPVEDSSDYLDIDKSWHAIHFLLTADAWDGKVFRQHGM